MVEGVFAQCQIALDLGTSLPFREKQKIRKAITENAGVISFIINKKCTHLVVADVDKARDSYKGRTALKYGIPVLSIDYITACVQEGRLVDTDPFLVLGNTKVQELGVGKVAANKGQEISKKSVYINLSNIPVWIGGDRNDPRYSDNEYELVKCAILLTNNEKVQRKEFAVLEVHIFSSCDNKTMQSKFRIHLSNGEFTASKVHRNVVECRYVATADEALNVYTRLYSKYMGHPHNLKRAQAVPCDIGSPKFQQLQGEIALESADMNVEVAELVEHLWREAVGELEDVLSVDIKTIKLEQVMSAEEALLGIRKHLDKCKETGNEVNMKTVSSYTSDFYAALPHASSHWKNINNKRVVSDKYDLCQLIKDMISVNEATDWNLRKGPQSKYRAMGCHIECMTDFLERESVVELVELGTENISIKNIFIVERSADNAKFAHEVGGNMLLFHSSHVRNFVGILSRGLLLPKVVVDDFGGCRTDHGKLGTALYFADLFSTSAKYSSVSSTKRTRFMLLSEVVLGRIHEVSEEHIDWKHPPEGADSVQAVSQDTNPDSAFQDGEFAVYDTRQQRLKYLIEFTMADDPPLDGTVPIALGLGEAETCESSTKVDIDMAYISIENLKGVKDPLQKVKPGLLLKDNDSAVPLTEVHVRAKLVDLACQVVVLQAYYNPTDSFQEAKYVFPLEDTAVVCGFEAFINDKHIVGEVKDKVTAHREYREAIQEGHGAYLMDQDEETPDVFTVSVGNMPPRATVLIKITYVAEMKVDGELITFMLPASVAPWKQRAALDQSTQDCSDTIKISEECGRLSITASIHMPFDLRQIESPTHHIRIKKTAASAVVEMVEEQAWGEGFQLLIGLAEIHVPRMWVEKYDEDDESQACMLTFYPEFEAASSTGFEVVFVLDMSNSMKGSVLLDAKGVLLLALHHLPAKCTFNIVLFGSYFEELFPTCKLKSKDSIKQATNYIQNASAKKKKVPTATLR